MKEIANNKHNGKHGIKKNSFLMENISDFFLLSLNEDKKEYEVLHIDWKNLKMTTISRFEFTNNAPNKFISKSYINNKYEIVSKISVYDGEVDEEFLERLSDLRGMPKY